MGKTDNITKWACDRCGAEVYAVPGDQTADSWGQPKRINFNGNEDTVTLCPDCLQDYKLFSMQSDRSFANFMKNKGE